MEDLSKDTEIQEALKEFEAKNAEQVISKPPANQKAESPKMIILAMKHSGGLIKDERQAEYALLGFAIICIIISLLFFFPSGDAEQTEERFEDYIDQSQFMFDQYN
ncbi:MAG: hypothetical protein M3M85_00290 [bacterium]|nr:hypothetical protein [bacterium]